MEEDMGAIEEQARSELTERRGLELSHLLAVHLSDDKFDPTRTGQTGEMTENNERR